MLQLRLFGTFELTYGGKSIAMPSRLAQSLLAYLMLNPGTSHRREKLAGLFWPDSPEERARASLRHEIWRIRKVLVSNGAKDILFSDGLTVALDPASEYWLDVDAVNGLGDEASVSQLIEGLSAYGGELLPGFYEDWVISEREHLQAVFEKHLSRLVDLLLREQRWAEVIEWAERWVKLGQNPDAAYRALMLAHAGVGDRVKMLATYERCEQALAELGLEPSEEIQLLAQVKMAVAPLPSPVTSFIGRHREVEEVSALLMESRLVTLTGAGGVGKTRLAIEVARAVASRFPDGVFHVELASLQDPTLLSSLLLGALRIPASSNEQGVAAALLESHFRSRHALLVLDNCEHLIEACAHLAISLVASCPALHILATSREALRVDGETAYRVPSLGLPSMEGNEPLAVLANVDSVKLFMERGRARVQSFALTSENAIPICQICQRLDGIPMAIELAAGRIGSMSAASILNHLNDRFAILTGGSRTALARHQTLRALIDWSYGLLTQPEQTLFRRLSVFAGGWTLEAAQEVTGTAGHQPTDVLMLLPELVEKSLVVLDPARGRYHLLESVRQYASEKLSAAGEQAEIRARHLDYFIALAEAADLAAAEGEASQVELAGELDNIMTAIQWCASAEDGVQKGLQLIGAARLTWLLLGQIDLAYRLVREFLALPGAEVRNRARRRALVTMAQAAHFLGYCAGTRPAMEESLSIAREIGDRRGEVVALQWLGVVACEVQDYESAVRYFEDASRLARELGLRRLAAVLLNDMAEVHRMKGEFAAAKVLYEQAVAAQRVNNTPHELMVGLMNLAATTISLGELPPARERLHEVFKLMREVPFGLTDPAPALEISACLLTAAGNCHHAAVLFGAAEHQRQLDGTVVEPSDQRLVIGHKDQARRALGDADFGAAAADGRHLTAAKAVSQAEAWLEAVGASSCAH